MKQSLILCVTLTRKHSCTVYINKFTFNPCVPGSNTDNYKFHSVKGQTTLLINGMKGLTTSRFTQKLLSHENHSKKSTSPYKLIKTSTVIQ